MIREYGPEYTNKLFLGCPRCGQEYLVDGLPWLVDGSPAPEHQDCPAVLRGAGPTLRFICVRPE